jgi:hypothetical protein
VRAVCSTVGARTYLYRPIVGRADRRLRVMLVCVCGGGGVEEEGIRGGGTGLCVKVSPGSLATRNV